MCGRERHVCPEKQQCKPGHLCSPISRDRKCREVPSCFGGSYNLFEDSRPGFFNLRESFWGGGWGELQQPFKAYVKEDLDPIQ